MRCLPAITSAAIGGPAPTASAARIAASIPYCASNCGVLAPRLRSVAISSAWRSTSIVETTSR